MNSYVSHCFYKALAIIGHWGELYGLVAQKLQIFTQPVKGILVNRPDLDRELSSIFTLSHMCLSRHHNISGCPEK